jgi:hypothetical protein
VNPNEDTELRRLFDEVALRRQGVMTGASEYRGLRVDGTIFDIEVNSERMRDAEGTPAGLVVIVRDITARRQAEAEQERLEAMNRQLQKSESLGHPLCLSGARPRYDARRLLIAGVTLTRERQTSGNRSNASS